MEANADDAVSASNSDDGRQIDGYNDELRAMEEGNVKERALEMELRPTKVLICRTCVDLKLERDFLFRKCENFERQVTELKLENAQMKRLLSSKDKEINRLNEMMSYDSAQDVEDSDCDIDQITPDVIMREVTENENEDMVFEDVRNQEHEPVAEEATAKENLSWEKWMEFQDMMRSRMNENGEVVVKQEPQDEEKVSEKSENEQDFDEESEEEKISEDDTDEDWGKMNVQPKKKPTSKPETETETEKTNDADKPQVCRWVSQDQSSRCDQEFSSIAELVKHMTRKHVGRTKPKLTHFLCMWEECRMKDHVFRLRQQLVNHLRMHTGERPYKCTFAGCGKTFPHKAHMYQHNRAHFFLTKPCTYPGCRKIFRRKNNLDDHYRIVHMKDDRLKCTFPDCGKLFAQPDKLRTHLQRHESAKTYYCKKAPCKMLKFSTQEEFERHRAQHAQAKMHKCDVEGCGQMFAMKRDLTKHKMTHPVAVPPDKMVPIPHLPHLRAVAPKPLPTKVTQAAVGHPATSYTQPGITSPSVIQPPQNGAAASYMIILPAPFMMKNPSF